MCILDVPAVFGVVIHWAFCCQCCLEWVRPWYCVGVAGVCVYSVPSTPFSLVLVQFSGSVHFRCRVSLFFCSWGGAKDVNGTSPLPFLLAPGPRWVLVCSLPRAEVPEAPPEMQRGPGTKVLPFLPFRRCSCCCCCCCLSRRCRAFMSASSLFLRLSFCVLFLVPWFAFLNSSAFIQSAHPDPILAPTNSLSSLEHVTVLRFLWRPV